MPRNPDYLFIETDTEALISLLAAAYERITGAAIQPASPERLFLQWVAAVVLQERVLSNYAANQNIPSRAEGANLDALAELTHARSRPQASSAVCTMRFAISEPQERAVRIPGGTRVTDANAALVWETEADAVILAGESSIEAKARCQTPGTVGNGWAAGQINTLVDVYDYYDHCTNVTASGGGADTATDDEYYELMRSSMDAYSCAGSRGGYIYFAKQVSTEIADIAANSPTPGVVKLYVLMEDGTPAGEEVKAAVLAACSADEVRPLTDQVSVEDPETVPYDIAFTYYLQAGSSRSAAETAAAVQAAVDTYTAWQSARLGRDINPSYLISLLMQTGIKRVELTAPAFAALRDGGDRTVPQVARVGTVSIQNGGYEDE